LYKRLHNYSQMV